MAGVRHFYGTRGLIIGFGSATFVRNIVQNRLGYQFRVSDPYSFYTGPDPAFQAGYRSGFSPDPGFYDQKLEKLLKGRRLS
jgi:hypothetical protein